MSIPPSPVRLPAGVRDLLPRAAARRRAIAERVLAELEAWGYTRLITPVFECADVLERGLGADARAAALRFVEPGSGEVVALRPDFTPQVARIAATRLADVDGPLRLCYEGAVNRLTSPTRGPLAQREILQAGIELIGAGGVDGDAEVLAVASATLAHLGVEAAPLDVGHVAPARWVLAGVGDEARPALALALARKDRQQVARVAAGAPGELPALAVALVGLTGPADDTLARARALPWPAAVDAALAELVAALAAAARLYPGARFTVDLGDLRGFDYSTGLRFAGYARGAGDAVLRGGRYDELVGRYGRRRSGRGRRAQRHRAQGLGRRAPPAPPRSEAGRSPSDPSPRPSDRAPDGVAQLAHVAPPGWAQARIAGGSRRRGGRPAPTWGEAARPAAGCRRRARRRGGTTVDDAQAVEEILAEQPAAHMSERSRLVAATS
ncbi:MAG: ATP phosphoribosyltransferase regulatory subunit [Kofleriaceae bacterium]|nr:ATP phosphoribosyltransferase regulatory subunit [Kofleriaceae bacterium]